MARPSLRSFLQNWSSYDAPLTTKLALAAKNNAIKLKNRSNCCGNHGEPGC